MNFFFQNKKIVRPEKLLSAPIIVPALPPANASSQPPIREQNSNQFLILDCTGRFSPILST